MVKMILMLMRADLITELLEAAQDLQKQQETLLAPIQAKLQQAIQAVGAENGFTYIFDLAIPSIIYKGNGSEDVTALVKAKLGIK